MTAPAATIATEEQLDRIETLGLTMFGDKEVTRRCDSCRARSRASYDDRVKDGKKKRPGRSKKEEPAKPDPKPVPPSIHDVETQRQILEGEFDSSQIDPILESFVSKFRELWDEVEKIVADYEEQMTRIREVIEGE